MELIDFPFTGTKRPFDWYLSEPASAEVPSHYLASEDIEEAYADLRVAMTLYLLNRRKYYVNYMAGAKALFSIFFPATHPLKESCPEWYDHITKMLWDYEYYVPGQDWSPAYEIQRLWIATKIHWSWLELAWVECEEAIFNSGQDWQVARTERVRKWQPPM